MLLKITVGFNVLNPFMDLSRQNLKFQYKLEASYKRELVVAAHKIKSIFLTFIH